MVTTSGVVVAVMDFPSLGSCLELLLSLFLSFFPIFVGEFQFVSYVEKGIVIFVVFVISFPYHASQIEKEPTVILITSSMGRRQGRKQY